MVLKGSSQKWRKWPEMNETAHGSFVKQLALAFWIRKSKNPIGDTTLPRSADRLPSAGVTALPLRPVALHSVSYALTAGVSRSLPRSALPPWGARPPLGISLLSELTAFLPVTRCRGPGPCWSTPPPCWLFQGTKTKTASNLHNHPKPAPGTPPWDIPPRYKLPSKTDRRLLARMRKDHDAMLSYLNLSVVKKNSLLLSLLRNFRWK